MPEVDYELYQVIRVSGADAEPFLQGQLTQDVTRLSTTGTLLSAWCNPKGRVIVVLWLVALDEGIGLLVPGSLTDSLVRRLTLYRLRSDVRFDVLDDSTAEAAGIKTDPAALMDAAIPVIDERNSESFTPHMLNLDKLDAVSFRKGCYTGQEVVARTENLGKSKRRIMRYQADRDGVSVGDKLSADDRQVGEVVNVCNRDVLAVVPIEMHGQPLAAGGARLMPLGLPYDL